MAKPRFTDPIEPMDLANMRQNGVRSLAVQCPQCRHEVILNVDHLPGDLTVPIVRASHAVHKVWNDRRRRASELEGARVVSQIRVLWPSAAASVRGPSLG